MTSPTFLMPQHGNLPHGDPSPLTTTFWEGCAAGELLFQRCAQCDGANFPPSEHCRFCTAFDLVWERSLGRGRLYSWTVVHRAVTPAFQTPYAPAIVTLDEGYQMMSNIVGLGAAELRIDLAVHVAFHQTHDASPWKWSPTALLTAVLPYFTAPL